MNKTKTKKSVRFSEYGTFHPYNTIAPAISARMVSPEYKRKLRTNLTNSYLRQIAKNAFHKANEFVSQTVTKYTPKDLPTSYPSTSLPFVTQDPINAFNKFMRTKGKIAIEQASVYLITQIMHDVIADEKTLHAKYDIQITDKIRLAEEVEQMIDIVKASVYNTLVNMTPRYDKTNPITKEAYIQLEMNMGEVLRKFVMQEAIRIIAEVLSSFYNPLQASEPITVRLS